MSTISLPLWRTPPGVLARCGDERQLVCLCRFIVELQPNSPAQTAETICDTLTSEGTGCSHMYYRVFKGFSADVSVLHPALRKMTLLMNSGFRHGIWILQDHHHLHVQLSEKR